MTRRRGGAQRAHMETRAGYLQRVRGQSPDISPTEPEYRERPVSPAPAASLADQFAEMVANDVEFHAWREAEARGSIR